MPSGFDWPAAGASPYLKSMRSLPVFPLLLLVLGLLLCTGESWAGPQDDSPAPPPPGSADSSSETETAETEAKRRARLTQERDTILAEIAALEEGYSDLNSAETADGAAEEAQLSARLTQLQTRLKRLDRELAKPNKGKK